MNSTKSVSIEPNDNELPTFFADRLGIEYAARMTPIHKKNLGQYFTPIKVAQFMSNFIAVKKSVVRIMDPGCGTGILSCALIEKLVEIPSVVREINLVAFENDNALIELTDISLNYLADWLKKKGVSFSYFLCKNDFILHSSQALKTSVETSALEEYDYVITNPPYFKLSKKDPRVIAANIIINSQTNIYSIFLMISAKLLAQGGRLIFITPRSFASGSYFRLFRNEFFKIIELSHIHLFTSRKEAFERDKILQENIIVIGTKRNENNDTQLQLAFPADKGSSINISYSTGVDDLSTDQIRQYFTNELISFQSDQKIIHIPTSINDEQAIEVFKTWSNRLADLGLKISTGPVVDFRNIDFIRIKSSKKTVPLIYLHNVEKMKFKWPNEKKNRGKKKGEYIVYNDLSKKRLIDNQDCIFLRRFSSKDDNSRLIATPYFSTWLKKYKKIGIENHLNYIYRSDSAFYKDELMGLVALLNSRLFDIYFRTFNGNLNVSSTELREMPLPSRDDIIAIGVKIQNALRTDQYIIDKIIENYFKINLINGQHRTHRFKNKRSS